MSAETDNASLSGRIAELEGLRGVLAWTVVAAHILICCGWFGPTFLGHNLLSDVAESAVDVFILLSGFVITRLVLVERESYGRYLWRRACRIMPAYWVALAAGIALNGILAGNLAHFFPNSEAQNYAEICARGAAQPWLHGLLHGTLLHGLAPASWIPAGPYTLLGVAWSLSLEWQFYLVAPLVITFASRSAGRLAIVALVSIVCGIFSASVVVTFSNAFLPAKALFFFAGGISYVLYDRQKVRAIFALFCAALGASLMIGSGRPVEAILPVTVWAVAIASIDAKHPGAVSFALRSRLLQYLGRISYSTYLVHAPVITTLQFLIWRFVNPATHSALFLITTPFAIAATCAVSSLSWRLIERPGQRIGRVGARERA